MTNKLYWGCVESRDDPLFLGRVKVRVVSLHTNNKVNLPTEDLPWATPLQPIVSAAMSGIGHAPVGPVEGSWVAIQFLDDEQQYPIMIGVIGGIPGLSSSVATAEDFTVTESEDEIPANVVKTGSGGILVDGSGNPVTTTPSADAKVVGSLTQTQYDTFKAAVRQKESGNRYSIMGGSGGAYAGAYQLGIAALEDLGYIKKGTYGANGGKASVFDMTDIWTGKDGVSDKNAFLNNSSVQDSAFDRYVKINLSRLKSIEPSKVIPEKLAGLLGVAHNQGAGAVTKLLDGKITADGFGTSTAKYYSEVGYKSIAGKTTSELPNRQNIYDEAVDKALPPPSATTNQYDVSKSPVVKAKAVMGQVGFKDPNNIYPKRDHVGEPDTNRLARNQKINNTIVGDKEATRIKSIPVANSSTTWDEPTVPYNAKYPFNHVFQSESGHIMEFDDTPDAERINLHHRTGTFFEVDPHGNKTEKVKGGSVYIVEKDGLFYVQGSGHVCIDGDLSVKVKSALHIQVLGNANINIKGDLNTIIEGNKYEYVKGNSHSIVGGNRFDTIDNTYNVKTNSLNSESSSGTSIRAGDKVAIDGFQIHMNSGLSTNATDATMASISYSPVISQPMPISRTEVESMKMEDTPEAKIQAAEAAKSEPPKKEEAKDTTVPTKPEPVPGDCSAIPTPYTNSTILSTNFTVGKLCKDGAFPPTDGQRGMTQAQLICNGMQLAVNIVEPLWAKYASKGMVINSCFRAVKSGKSQHEIFQACDIGFKPGGNKLSKKEYYDIAVEIKNTLQFDQLLLEYRDPGQYWLHISFNKNGNRNQVLTLLNDKTYAQGLVLLG